MKQYITIDEYITNFPEHIQSILQTIRTLIQQTAPEATETISYGIPTFKLSGKNLVHFAAYEHHIGLYPWSAAIAAFADDLKNYKTSKGTIQFALTEDIPYAFIQKIVVRCIHAGHR